MRVLRQLAKGIFNWIEVPEQNPPVTAKIATYAVAPKAPPCHHLGAPTGETVTCPDCKGSVELKAFSCSSLEASPSGVCVQPTKRRIIPEIGCCVGCRSYRPMTTDVIKETVINPVPRSDTRDAFNASLFRRANGKMYLAYRTGQGGSNIHVAQMSESLVPGPSVMLNLRHDFCTSSREDPRLFEHRGQLHASFVGVVGDPGHGKPGSTHVLYASLNEALVVERVWCPRYQFANPTWEKSWMFFSWQRELFAAYTIKPHVVLHINGDEALPFAEHSLNMPWTGGHLRGGASPILVGDEYWSWFHGSVEKGFATPAGPAGTKVYNVGVYCFEAKPPFRPTRMTPTPVLWADETTRLPAWCAVTFPCGAVLDNGRWKVSLGIHDREIRVYEWRHEDIEKAMVAL